MTLVLDLDETLVHACTKLESNVTNMHTQWSSMIAYSSSPRHAHSDLHDRLMSLVDPLHRSEVL